MSRQQKYQICRFVFIFGLVLIFGTTPMFFINDLVAYFMAAIGVTLCSLSLLKAEDFLE